MVEPSQSCVRGNSELAGKSGEEHIWQEEWDTDGAGEEDQGKLLPCICWGTWGSCRPAGQTGQKNLEAKQKNRNKLEPTSTSASVSASHCSQPQLQAMTAAASLSPPKSCTFPSCQL